MNDDQIRIEQLKAQLILIVVCRAFNVSEDCVRGDCRKREYVLPRHIAMTLLAKFVKMSWKEIGNYFCKDHTTAINASYQIRDLVKCYPDEKERIRIITEEVLTKINHPPEINLKNIHSHRAVSLDI